MRFFAIELFIFDDLSLDDHVTVMGQSKMRFKIKLKIDNK